MCVTVVIPERKLSTPGMVPAHWRFPILEKLPAMPASTVSVSADGARFTPLVKIEHKVRRDDQVTFKRYEWTGSVSARYVRMEADAAKEFGGVLFTDEIVIK